MMDGIKGWRIMMMFSWAGWVNREQLQVIDYLKDENETLRKLIKKQRIRLSLEDRRRLGVKGRAIGRKNLQDVATIARADTILGWFTYYIYFVIELKTRRVQIAGMTPNPDGLFMTQIARNLTDCQDGFLRGKWILLRDRDKKYTGKFDSILRDAGIEPKPLPARSPNLNACAERFVLTLKSECLDRMIFLGEASLRHALSEFMEHYHAERNHQSLDNGLIQPSNHMGSSDGTVQRRQRLGGMLNYYYRLAA